MYEYCLKCLHECDKDICDQCEFGKEHIYPTKFKALPIKKFEQAEQKDTVNHPAHYETGKFECIEVMKEVYGVESVKAFCLLNAFKYLYRCKRKDNKTEDIKKANWYINKYLELESE